MPSGQYCGPSKQKMQSDSKNIECDIEEYTLHGKNQLQGTDKSLYVLLSLLDFADINQICPYLIERRKYFARIMENLSVGRLLTLIDGEVKGVTSQINNVLDSIRYILKQIYTIYDEYLRN